MVLYLVWPQLWSSHRWGSYGLAKIHKISILVSWICFNFFKAVYVQRIHHVLLQVIPSLHYHLWKNCFITSLFILLSLYNFALCPRVPLHPWSKIKKLTDFRFSITPVILIKSDLHVFLLSSKLHNCNLSNLSIYGKCPKPLIILVNLLCILSRSSLSLE